MDPLSGEGLKSVELVDNFLDIDEALQSYLVTLNERRVVTPSMQEQQQQQTQGTYGDTYDLNATQPFLETPQFVSAEQGYFQNRPSATALGIVDTKPSIVGYENNRRPAAVVRNNSSAQRSVISKAADARHSQVQEKNRMAQKRFRERQKAKINELHQQITTLEQRVEQLVMENASLQSHNSLLEKVLAMRDEHIKLVQQQQAVESEQTEQEKEYGTRRSSLSLTAIKGKELKLSTESLKKMTPEDVMQIWHTYVTEISSALVEFNSSTGGSTNRIRELIEEVSKVFMRLCVINPLICKVWVVREYHTSEIEELRKWQSVLGQLKLSEIQKTELVQLRRLYIDQLQGLVDERKKLHLTIQTILVSQTVAHKIALEHLKTNQTVIRLRDILRVENNAMLQFCSTIIHKVISSDSIGERWRSCALWF